MVATRQGTNQVTGEQLYALFVRMNEQVMHCGVDPWDMLSFSEDQAVWNAMAEAIAVEFDPSASRAALALRLTSAECVLRQVSRDTWGEELGVKEFAERSGYDS